MDYFHLGCLIESDVSRWRCFNLVQDYFWSGGEQCIAEHSRFFSNGGCALCFCVHGDGLLTSAGLGELHHREDVLARDVCQQLVLMVSICLPDFREKICLNCLVSSAAIWDSFCSPYPQDSVHMFAFYCRVLCRPGFLSSTCSVLVGVFFSSFLDYIG